jgi:hypothetical protein
LLTAVGLLGWLAFHLLPGPRPVPGPGSRELPDQTGQPPTEAAARGGSAGNGPVRPEEGTVSKNRFALLVGINGYEHEKLPPLRYAAQDAAELAQVLEQAGYQVTLLTDVEGKRDPGRRPSRANIGQHLTGLLQRPENDKTPATTGVLLFPCPPGRPGCPPAAPGRSSRGLDRSVTIRSPLCRLNDRPPPSAQLLPHPEEQQGQQGDTVCARGDSPASDVNGRGPG